MKVKTTENNLNTMYLTGLQPIAMNPVHHYNPWFCGQYSTHCGLWFVCSRYCVAVDCELWTVSYMQVYISGVRSTVML